MAAMGLQAEAEGWRRLVRAVTRLQACVRGYLLRKRFGRLQAEYEEVVLEIEGDLRHLEWRGHLLPQPVFVPEQPTQGKGSGLQEAVLSEEASTEKPQEELDPSEPEQDGSCSSVEPTAHLQREKELSSAAAGDAGSPPNLGGDADKGIEKGCSAPEESKDNSSMWASTVLEAEPLAACLAVPLEDMKQFPQTRSGLQAYRNHLLMELLWLQQAIASRENYLMLKKKLETPDP